MTQEEVVAHWRKGAKDALEMATLALRAGKYDHALFNCHLAVEKALKAAYIAEHDKDHPHTHDLVNLSEELNHMFDQESLLLLEDLTGIAIDARYNDPQWADEQATEVNARRTIERTLRFFTTHYPNAT